MALRRRRARKRMVGYNPAAQKPITKRRDRARLIAILIGVGITAAAYGLVAFIVGYIFAETGNFPDNFLAIVLGIGSLVLVGAGAYGIYKARKYDDENYMIQKATPMPLSLANEHDDLWTEGRIRVPRPLIAPRFAQRCAFFHYKEEERRSSGKSSHWVTISEYKRHTHAWIEQGELDVKLDLGKAEFQYLPTANQRSGRRRYTLKYLPAVGRASACGVITVSEFKRAPKDDPRLVPPRGSLAARGERPGRSALDNPRVEQVPDDPFSGFDNTPRALRVRRRKEARAARRQTRRRKLIPPKGSPAWKRSNRDRDTGEDSELDPDAQDVSDLNEVLTELSGEEKEKQPDEQWKPAKPWLLTPMGNVPLMVTPLPRNDWYDRAEAKEVHWGVASSLMLWFGLSGLFWWLQLQVGAFPMEFQLTPLILSLVVGFVVLLPILAILIYNRFVSYRVRVKNAWAHIDADLRMRHDLVPGLVEVVKAYSDQEAGVFEKLAAMRTTGNALQAAHDALEREAGMTRLAQRLVAVVEDYPDLKANTTYARLQRELKAMEEKIAHGRSFYNEVVREYNTLVETFPNALVAPALGFRTMPYWHEAS